MAGVNVQLLRGRAGWEAARRSRMVLRRFGWDGVAGALLLAGATGFGIFSGLQAVNGAEIAYRIEQARQSAGSVAVAAVPMTPQGGLDTFYDYLPVQEEIPGTIQRLIELARSERLRLQTGEYKAEPASSARFLAYRMTLPVKGDASAIQRFLLAALKEHKTLALESVTFKRDRIESAAVEARIQFVLLTRTLQVSRPPNKTEVGGPS